ncbi:hypothetical protein A7U60_g3759 [Sanghuangporus baumii]|uniref:Uncharacterized protein n=1 Tax=Sanghuangporus baumii TaxID=108892 RepID=A0A9Q5I025_SANBA|nr:hypothetical protein A7U60_g3759 [Sanghuangporus baumii]
MLVIEQRRPEQVEVSALLVVLELASDAVKVSVSVDVADPSLAEVTVGRIPQKRPVHVVLSDSETAVLGTDVSVGTEPLLPVSVVCVSDELGKIPHNRPVQLSDVDEALSPELVGDERIPHNDPVHVVEASEGEELESTDEIDPELEAELTPEGTVVTPSHCWLVLPTLVGAESVLKDVARLDPKAVVDASELVPPIPLDTTLDPEGEVTGALDSEGTLVMVAVADEELPLDSEVVTGPQRALTPRPNNCNPAAQEVVGAASDEDCVVPSNVETELVEELPSDESGTELVEGDVDRDVDVLADVVKSDDGVESEDDNEAVDDAASVADDESMTEVTGVLELVADDVGSEDDDEAVDDAVPDVGDESITEVLELVANDVGSEDDDEAVDDAVLDVGDESVTEVLELVEDATELFGVRVIPRI